MDTATFLPQLHQQAQIQKDIICSEFMELPLATLNFKPHATGWSILECVEHLNRYSRFYLPHCERTLASTSTPPTLQPVRYSWLGKKSLDLVNPSSTKKHKTLKHMNPHNSQLTPNVLDEFQQHQETLLRLLNTATTADLNKKSVPVEFLKLLKMRLGEALEFLVLHQQRHLQQALRAKEQALQPIGLVI
ncbi:DinB family protein [Rufibacter sp. XAAS-G3-1]|uniref:DinB family protein n=1 Tax=Rufibacter sp. XAAS-G3-1 TaxID=2729134 RepID=UPI0015E6EA73|nr:DinB family protein [Rufibacter sp. XAAS-G3-1]